MGECQRAMVRPIPAKLVTATYANVRVTVKTAGHSLPKSTAATLVSCGEMVSSRMIDLMKLSISCQFLPVPLIACSFILPELSITKTRSRSILQATKTAHDNLSLITLFCSVAIWLYYAGSQKMRRTRKTVNL